MIKPTRTGSLGEGLVKGMLVQNVLTWMMQLLWLLQAPHAGSPGEGRRRETAQKTTWWPTPCQCGHLEAHCQRQVPTSSFLQNEADLCQSAVIKMCAVLSHLHVLRRSTIS